MEAWWEEGPHIDLLWTWLEATDDISLYPCAVVLSVFFHYKFTVWGGPMCFSDTWPEQQSYWRFAPGSLLSKAGCIELILATSVPCDSLLCDACHHPLLLWDSCGWFLGDNTQSWLDAFRSRAGIIALLIWKSSWPHGTQTATFKYHHKRPSRTFLKYCIISLLRLL